MIGGNMQICNLILAVLSSGFVTSGLLLAQDVEMENSASISRAWQKTVESASKGKPTKLAVERFVGFVEGKLDITVPESWSATLSRGKLNTPKAKFQYEGKSPFWKAADGLAVRISKPFKIEKDNDSNFVLVGEKTRMPLIGFVPPSMFSLGDRGRKIGAFVAAIELDGCVVLALCSKSPSPYEIAFFNSEGGTNWVESVHCSPNWNSISLDSRVIQPMAELYTSKKDVVVFGCANGVAYFEVFETKTGKPKCRFSTEKQLAQEKRE